jgi:hypothetical protein
MRYIDTKMLIVSPHTLVFPGSIYVKVSASITLSNEIVLEIT